MQKGRKIKLEELADEQWVTSMAESKEDSPLGRAFATVGLPTPIPLKALPVELPTWDIPNMIITNPGRAVGPVASKFLDTVRELARSLGY